jgi:hypothetical protein
MKDESKEEKDEKDEAHAGIFLLFSTADFVFRLVFEWQFDDESRTLSGN